MNIDTVKIVGGHGKRRAMDFYPTPPDVTRAVMGFLNLPRGTVVWEPACGDGAMTAELDKGGYKTIGTDIMMGADFLETEKPEGAEWIITNPPFSLAEAFIRRAAEMKLPFAMLLKSQYWHSAKRRPLFEEIRPMYICPLTWRPDFTREGASLLDMIWTVWGKESAAITQYIPLKRPKEA